MKPPKLKEFCRAMLEWIETGENPHNFTTNFGCCGNYEWRFGGRGLYDFFGDAYPFNLNQNGFYQETKSGATYQNPKRLEWLKENAQ